MLASLKQHRFWTLSALVFRLATRGRQVAVTGKWLDISDIGWNIVFLSAKPFIILSRSFYRRKNLYPFSRLIVDKSCSYLFSEFPETGYYNKSDANSANRLRSPLIRLI